MIAVTAQTDDDPGLVQRRLTITLGQTLQRVLGGGGGACPKGDPAICHDVLLIGVSLGRLGGKLNPLNVGRVFWREDLPRMFPIGNFFRRDAESGRFPPFKGGTAWSR